MAHGVVGPNIAQWSGQAWSALGAGVDGPVTALAATTRDLYVGGSFRTAGGVQVNGFARWTDRVWDPMGGSNSVRYGAGAIVSAEDKVYVADGYDGNGFTGPETFYTIKVWDGSRWASMADLHMRSGPGCSDCASVLTDMIMHQGAIHVSGMQFGYAKNDFFESS